MCTYGRQWENGGEEKGWAALYSTVKRGLRMARRFGGEIELLHSEYRAKQCQSRCT